MFSWKVFFREKLKIYTISRTYQISVCKLVSTSTLSSIHTSLIFLYARTQTPIFSRKSDYLSTVIFPIFVMNILFQSTIHGLITVLPCYHIFSSTVKLIILIKDLSGNVQPNLYNFIHVLIKFELCKVAFKTSRIFKMMPS